MGYLFRPGLHACDPGGALVFLDVFGDRYFALGGLARGACLRLVDGARCRPDEQTIIDDLVRNDVLRRVGADARPVLCANLPCRGVALNDHRTGESARVSVAASIGRIVAAIVELKVRRLDEILATLVAAKGRCALAEPADSDAGGFALAFEQADRLLTTFNLCLPRSIALARAMMAGGLVPSLVIGVKLRPFEAHCWVQHRDILIGNDIGTITPFTPILIL